MSNEQQAQELVAWRYRFLSENGSGLWIFSLKEPVVGDTTRVTVQPLYTAPPLRDLSDEEIKRVFGMCGVPQTNSLTWLVRECVKAAREKV